MKKLNLNWSVSQFMAEWKKGSIGFEYPIQRVGGQWTVLQRSLLIHSLAEDFPVPSIYAIDEVVEVPQKKDPTKMKKIKVYQILDGKQRLTTIRDFLNNEFSLHKDTPKAIVDGEEYDLGEKKFEELDEVVQQAIQNFSLLIYKLEDATDEQIEDIFFRLNNGTPLSKQQKSKARMGAEWAKKIKEIVDHPFMEEKTSFTAHQIKKSDNEMAILQAMMLIEEYEWKSFSSNHVAEYADTFRGDDEKNNLVVEVLKALNYLNDAFEEKEKVLLRKVHFPMVIVTALEAIEKNISPEKFADWKEEFKRALNSKSSIKTRYRQFGGDGSVKKEKVKGRVAE
ncbi:DUF262 domain-containing protein, partial [Bacillus pumilus]|uniref:DUF262 domain-containing protein n=1 Tax=Bacillus pumilus TaxID=1408 RepID=UPI00119E8BF4